MKRVYAGSRPVVTTVLVVLMVLIWVGDVILGANIMSGQKSWAVKELGLWAPYVTDLGQWYRVITSGFAHIGVIHLGFNCYFLYTIGDDLENALGSPRYLILFIAGVVGGSLGAVLIEPIHSVAGASGAVFALMGAIVMIQKSVDINPFSSGIGGLLLVNLLLSFRSGVSLGGHVGGLIAGLVVGYIFANTRQRSRISPGLGFGAAIMFIGLLLLALIPSLNRATALVWQQLQQ